MRILIIEDDKDIINFLKPRLKNEGFAVDIASDGENGSFLGRTNEYDLIILDYLLPKKDGFQVCQEIRERGKDIPILMISVKTDTPLKVTILNSGADDFIGKPYAFDELLARIRALLRRPKHIEAEVLKIDDLIIDTRRCTVRRCEKNIYLTRKEFALLECLIKNKGLVVSRGTILEHVWEKDADPFSNTLEAHILNLRRKIELPNKKKLIHTLSGRGYKID